MNEQTLRTVCKANFCTGCMACIGVCKKEAIMIQDSLKAFNAIIDNKKCVNCGLCDKVCPNNNRVELTKPIGWWEGWASETIRMRAASGGAASAMMKRFVEDGGYVASCLFKNGEFVFDVTNKLDNLMSFSGSKYVKSNPIGIYSKVVDVLRCGDKVLFIGLPCQVAAMKNYAAILSADKIENLYTVDLICHGTPSYQILKLALSEIGIDVKCLTNIRFRNKTHYQVLFGDVDNDYKEIMPTGMQDMYTYTFLSAMVNTENCYSCQYATLGRPSDVTIGDSWGSNLPSDEQCKGVSLLLCQTEKGINLVNSSGMKLKEVSLENAIKTNHQLSHPPIPPKERKIFFDNLDKGFHKAVSKSSPVVYYKQKLKKVLIGLKIISRKTDRIEYQISVRK